MTRKDYELIAAALRDTRDLTDWAEPHGLAELNGVARAAQTLADRLHSTNPRFDRARFLKACGA